MWLPCWHVYTTTQHVTEHLDGGTILMDVWQIQGLFWYFVMGNEFGRFVQIKGRSWWFTQKLLYKNITNYQLKEQYYQHSFEIGIMARGMKDKNREMIFVQPFCNNFLTTFSLILTLCFYSLSSIFSLSLLFLTNKNRGNESCHGSCHQWLFIYHSS